MTISPFPAETIPADREHDSKDADSAGLEGAFFMPFFRGSEMLGHLVGRAGRPSRIGQFEIGGKRERIGEKEAEQSGA